MKLICVCVYKFKWKKWLLQGLRPQWSESCIHSPCWDGVLQYKRLHCGSQRSTPCRGDPTAIGSVSLHTSKLPDLKKQPLYLSEQVQLGESMIHKLEWLTMQPNVSLLGNFTVFHGRLLPTQCVWKHSWDPAEKACLIMSLFVCLCCICYFLLPVSRNLSNFGAGMWYGYGIPRAPLPIWSG